MQPKQLRRKPQLQPKKVTRQRLKRRRPPLRKLKQQLKLQQKLPRKPKKRQLRRRPMQRQLQRQTAKFRKRQQTIRRMPTRPKRISRLCERELKRLRRDSLLSFIEFELGFQDGKQRID
jgi:hypothetical protein